MFFAHSDGRLDFIEFVFNYHTSSSNFNHKGAEDFSYTAVVDYNNINLTPLGKFVMPPPMYEKQVTLKEGPPSLLYMYGHTVYVVSGSSLIVFSALDPTTTLRSYDLTPIVPTHQL